MDLGSLSDNKKNGPAGIRIASQIYVEIVRSIVNPGMFQIEPRMVYTSGSDGLGQRPVMIRAALATRGSFGARTWAPFVNLCKGLGV